MEAYSTLPTELVLNVFQSLDISSLKAVAQVCRYWEAIQKSDQIWERIYYKNLDLGVQPQLTDSSWKERSRILNNWFTGKFKRYNSFSCSSTDITENRPLTLINNQLFEVKHIESLFYSVVPCLSMNQLSSGIVSFDLENLGAQGPIVCTTLFENIWYALDCRGTIFCCDIFTGDSIKYTDPKINEIVNFRNICCSLEHIITEANGIITIWDRKSGIIKSKILVNLGTNLIHALHSSKNHIFCEIAGYNVTRYPIKSIHKQNKTISNLIKRSLTEIFQMAACDSQVAILDKLGTLHIFKESEEDLELTYKIEAFSLPDLSTIFGSLYFYHNWLLVSKENKLKIVNLKNGNVVTNICLTPQQKKLHQVSIRLDSSKLFIRHKVEDRHLGNIYCYKVFDFNILPR